jgi:hypothetical protein
MATTLVKSYLHACKITKRNPKNIPNFSKQSEKYKKRHTALHMLEIIYEAQNILDKFEPDYSKVDQDKWFVVFRHNGLKGKRAGFGFYFTTFGWADTHSTGGPRLVVFSDDRATDMGKKFEKLHNQYLSN